MSIIHVFVGGWIELLTNISINGRCVLSFGLMNSKKNVDLHSIVLYDIVKMLANTYILFGGIDHEIKY